MSVRPRWNDPSLKAGTMVKAALWLLDEVGAGNAFTKEQIRTAFPGITQADRRIRDLRSYGWTIWASTEDSSLLQDEQRFVKAGLEVWIPEERRKAASSTITAKERQAVFAGDSFMCTRCGISGAEEYPDAPGETAVLSISKKAVADQDGSISEGLVTECKRCRAGGGGAGGLDVSRVLTLARDLDDSDRARLLLWARRGRRGPTPVDRVWASIRELPVDVRSDVIRAIEAD